MEINFSIETRRIAVGKGGYFDVRGLNTDDLTFLSTYYLDDIKTAVAKHGKSSLPNDAVTQLILSCAREFGTLATEIISRCANAPEDRKEDFRNLPFSAVILALKAIWELSATDGGVEVGNLLKVIADLLDANGLKLGKTGNLLNDIISSVGKTSAS